MIQQQTYKQLFEEKRAFYQGIGSCYCRALQETVYFNSKGFKHLLFKGDGEPRTQAERISRLHLLSYVCDLLRETDSVVQHRLMHNVQYWKLQKHIKSNSLLVTIILRKTNEGKLVFYSVWKK